MIDYITKRYYLYSFLRSLNFVWPIMVLYYYNQWLNNYQVWIILSLRFFAPVLFEIPSSVWADKFSRKLLLIYWNLFSILWMILMIVWWNIWIIWIAVVSICISFALVSWTDEAFLYDNLWEETHRYEEIFSKSISIFFVGRAIACVVWWILYSISPKFPFLLNIVFLILSLVIVFTIKEWWFSKSDHNLFDHIKLWFSSIIKNKYVWDIFLYAISFVTMELLYFYFQPTLELKGLNAYWIWVIYAWINLISFGSAYLYNKLPWLTNHVHILRILFSLFATYVFINLNFFSIIVCSVFAFIIIGLSQTFISNILNKSVSSDIRATAISINNQFDFIFLSVVLYIFWIISNKVWVINAFYINYYIAWFGIFVYFILFFKSYFFKVNDVKYVNEPENN